mmetsp:Transcript_138734/g.386885  ORF Transcript_138734/g.386885 Transcript_138734/m.386885 type:complete len:276 (-) Transcript_138734:99-926(-)
MPAFCGPRWGLAQPGIRTAPVDWLQVRRYAVPPPRALDGTAAPAGAAPAAPLVPWLRAAGAGPAAGLAGSPGFAGTALGGPGNHGPAALPDAPLPLAGLSQLCETQDEGPAPACAAAAPAAGRGFELGPAPTRPLVTCREAPRPLAQPLATVAPARSSAGSDERPSEQAAGGEEPSFNQALARLDCLQGPGLRRAVPTRSESGLPWVGAATEAPAAAQPPAKRACVAAAVVAEAMPSAEAPDLREAPLGQPPLPVPGGVPLGLELDDDAAELLGG